MFIVSESFVTRKRMKIEVKNMARIQTENKKIDLRVLKTQKFLSNALFELLEEKPLDGITVQEICERAMINRMTFYKHYSDKYDLFGDCVKNIQREILSKVQKISPLETSVAAYCETLVENVIDFCDENRTILKKIALQEDVLASNILFNSMQENMERFLEKLSEGKQLYLPLPYSAAFITGGCVKLVTRWLSHNEDYSKEQLFADLKPFFRNYVKCDVLFKN